MSDTKAADAAQMLQRALAEGRSRPGGGTTLTIKFGHIVATEQYTRTSSQTTVTKYQTWTMDVSLPIEKWRILAATCPFCKQSWEFKLLSTAEVRKEEIKGAVVLLAVSVGLAIVATFAFSKAANTVALLSSILAIVSLASAIHEKGRIGRAAFSPGRYVQGTGERSERNRPGPHTTVD
jgi:hypothetical protein